MKTRTCSQRLGKGLQMSIGPSSEKSYCVRRGRKNNSVLVIWHSDLAIQEVRLEYGYILAFRMLHVGQAVTAARQLSLVAVLVQMSGLPCLGVQKK
jgi:hypothetical protein